MNDYIDGNYVMSVATPAIAERMPTRGSPIQLRDGLEIKISMGKAQVRADRYTGALLLQAAISSGDQPIEAVAFAPAGSKAAHLAGAAPGQAAASKPTLIGYYAGQVPVSQLAMAAVGGGACNGGSGLAGLKVLTDAMGRDLSPRAREALDALPGHMHKISMRVRAAVMATVIPVSPLERSIVWQHARYYGTETFLGMLRFTYNPAKRSSLSMAGTTPGFFPASGTNSIYCFMEMLDLGLAGGTPDPMLLPSKTITWPPYSTPMQIAKPVTFYAESKPAEALLTVTSNTMHLYDYNGSTIKRMAFRITAAGMLKAAFQVTNLTPKRFSGRWVLIGDHADATFAHTDKPLDLGPAGTAGATKVIEVSAPVRKSELTQTVSFAIMSISEPVVLGIIPTTFSYPST